MTEPGHRGCPAFLISLTSCLSRGEQSYSSSPSYDTLLTTGPETTNQGVLDQRLCGHGLKQGLSFVIFLGHLFPETRADKDIFLSMYGHTHMRAHVCMHTYNITSSIHMSVDILGIICLPQPQNSNDPNLSPLSRQVRPVITVAAGAPFYPG